MLRYPGEAFLTNLWMGPHVSKDEDARRLAAEADNLLTKIEHKCCEKNFTKEAQALEERVQKTLIDKVNNYTGSPVLVAR